MNPLKIECFQNTKNGNFDSDSISKRSISFENWFHQNALKRIKIQFEWELPENLHLSRDLLIFKRNNPPRWRGYFKIRNCLSNLLKLRNDERNLKFQQNRKNWSSKRVMIKKKGRNWSNDFSLTRSLLKNYQVNTKTIISAFHQLEKNFGRSRHKRKSNLIRMHSHQEE